MRSSAAVLAALSALAIAAPLQKRAYVTDVVVEFVTVTVTDGQPLPTTSSTISSTTPTTPVEIPTTTPEPVIPETTPVAVVPEVVEAPTPVEVVQTPTPLPVVAETAPEPVAQAAAAPEPVQPEPVQPEPVQPESVQPEPVQPEPVQPEPVQPEPVQPEPVQPKPVQPEPVQPKPVASEAPDTTNEETTKKESSAAPVPVSNDYKSTILHHHNIHRSNHSASALTYDDTLAGYAAQVASKCIYGHDRTPGGGGYGQNIAKSGSTGDERSGGANGPAARHISNLWYNSEVNMFTSYGQENPDMSNFNSWGHFSQIVWKGTGRVGCATQFCDSNTSMFSSGFSGWYTVCNYGAPGNMGGAYATNIGEPVGISAVIA